MSGRQKRFIIILTGFGLLALASALILTALEDNILFFHTPTELAALAEPPREAIRIGGLVKADSVVRTDQTIRFTITDFENDMEVRYQGILPDLFREGQGVVAEGRLGGDGIFTASLILAKHDENYMPPEVADSLSIYGYSK